MDAFHVPQLTVSEADAEAAASDEDSDATEHARGGLSAVTQEPLTKKRRTRSTVASEQQPGDAPEHANYSEDDGDDALPPDISSNDAAAYVADATGKKQMFTTSLAHRDDWLHRGIMLRDMDYYHYSRYVERVEMPRSGTLRIQIR